MTADVPLLPLPALPEKECDELGCEWIESQIEAYATDYARANVLHHTAAQAAEIEALRAERDVLAKEATKYADKSGRLQAEIEALRAEVERLTFEMGCLQQQYDERTAYMIVHRGAGLACSDAVRSAYSDEHHRAERLAEALRDVMPFVVTDVLEHCDGNKCREQWCAGCSGDDEASEAVARSAKAAGVAYALLHPTAAQENDDA